MMQYIQTKQAEERWSLHPYNFLAGSRKTVPHACRSEDWKKNSNAKLSQTSAGGKSESNYFPQELTYLRVFLSILPAESQRLYFPPPALS
jgi:hypothetical protein